ncbi:hypothetical protein PsYK624_101810 [Phanerochaete sordida]|uniref:Uncharacterized protein n=1 Tax=Phanerochaete sordida TaxID=48140 RepID=A0A9P3GFK7_9APHY|nr:hypothetical protein PsYK624_101810 [Phanerochaete sordida]
METVLEGWRRMRPRSAYEKPLAQLRSLHDRDTEPSCSLDLDTRVLAGKLSSRPVFRRYGTGPLPSLRQPCVSPTSCPRMLIGVPYEHSPGRELCSCLRQAIVRLFQS